MAEEIWILDTSIVVAWFFTDEPKRNEALAVRRRVGDHPGRFLVPPLFHSELVHVLARKSGRNARLVRDAVRLTLRLGIRTLLLPETALLRTVHWGCRGLSGYDATFVALAEDLGGRWLTADEQAAGIAGLRTSLSLTAWAEQQRG